MPDESDIHTRNVWYWLLYSVQQLHFGRFNSDLCFVFCNGFVLFQETYLGTLAISWLRYFRFENLLLLNRSWVSHFLSFYSKNASWSYMVSCCFPREHPPSLLVENIMVFASHVWVILESDQKFERNLWLSFIPSNCHFRSFVCKSSQRTMYPWNVRNCFTGDEMIDRIDALFWTSSSSWIPSWKNQYENLSSVE
jgi:hypothetical protein